MGDAIGSMVQIMSPSSNKPGEDSKQAVDSHNHLKHTEHGHTDYTRHAHPQRGHRVVSKLKASFPEDLELHHNEGMDAGIHDGMHEDMHQGIASERSGHGSHFSSSIDQGVL